MRALEKHYESLLFRIIQAIVDDSSTHTAVLHRLLLCRIAAIIALTSTMQSCAYVPTRPTLSWFRRVPAALQARRVSLTPMGDVGTQFDNSIQLFGSRAVGRKNDNCKILYSLVYEVTILMLLRCIVIFAWNMTSATSIPCRGDICLDPTLKSAP